ncbi:MAG: hypothetical protein DWQ04_18695 [Chloroflexi bacterium]|nr:MAG: hypothetical protein DWQ04_18695 [Chloroflexota bacterium]
MKERIEDLLAVYALGGLTEEERRQVESYVDANPAAKVELDDYLQTVDAMVLTAVPIQPALNITADLFARVEADARTRQAAIPGASAEVNGVKRPFYPKPAQSSPSVWETLKSFLSSPAVSGAGLALAAVMLIWAFVLLGRNSVLQSFNQTLAADNDFLEERVMIIKVDNEDLLAENELLRNENLTLTNRVTTLAQENQNLINTASTRAERELELEAEISSLVAMNNELSDNYADLDESTLVARDIMSILTSPTVDTVAIPGNPETQPDAAGQFVVDAASNTAILIVTGMGPLPEDSVYQVLLIQGSEHETAETFVVDTQGESVLIVSSENPLGTFDAVGVSIEPEGGSEQRTGEVVLLGSLLN